MVKKREPKEKAVAENISINQSGIVNVYKSNLCNAVFVQDELLSHADVSSKNLKAINTLKQCILNELSGSCEPIMPKPFVSDGKQDQFFEEKKVLTDNINTHQNVIMDTNNKIIKANKSIAQLNSQLKKIEEEMSDLKNAKKKMQQDFKSTIAAYQTAEKYYKTYYNFTVTVDTTLENNSYTATITFSKRKNYPVKFKIDRDTNCVISFEAAFLESEDQEKLRKNFEITGDVFTLVCDLRKLVLKTKYF